MPKITFTTTPFINNKINIYVERNTAITTRTDALNIILNEYFAVGNTNQSVNVLESKINEINNAVYDNLSRTYSMYFLFAKMSESKDIQKYSPELKSIFDLCFDTESTQEFIDRRLELVRNL